MAPRIPSPRSTRLALGMAAALGLGVVPATAALATAPVGPTVVFPSAGASQSYTVPASVCALTVSVAGAQGGAGALEAGNSGLTPTGGTGGRGGTGTATIPVVPGEVLTVDVGAIGGDGRARQSSNQAGGGFGGGANAGLTIGQPAAGAGGGATTVSVAGTPLVVAGGGGGGGGGLVAANGGTGGNVGQAGTAGGDSASGAGGGAGGTTSAGGAGGHTGGPWYNNGIVDAAGSAGTAGHGGLGATAFYSGSTIFGGGGGGGGYYGGGGGGSGNDYYNGGHSYNGAGGGGGGSGYVVAGATNVGTWAGHDGTGYGSASISPTATCASTTVTLDPITASHLPGQTTELEAIASVPGTVTFTAGGTAVCSAVATNLIAGSQEATCAWTPSEVGPTQVVASLTPSDPATYLSSTSASQAVTVTSCTRCTVTFDANGGTGLMAPQVFKGPSQNLTTNHFKRANWSFVGWALQANATTPDLANAQNFRPWGNQTLYAVWVHKTATVTFDANGGTGRMAPLSVSADSVVLTANSFALVGQTFQGWATKPTAKRPTIADGVTLPVTKDVTLYAVWR